MTKTVDHIDGLTFHGRKGAVENAFRYSVDYVLLDAEVSSPRAPWLFSRNRGRAFALHDSDHGGTPGDGSGAVWVREVLREHDLEFPIGSIELLAALPPPSSPVRQGRCGRPRPLRRPPRKSASVRRLPSTR